MWDSNDRSRSDRKLHACSVLLVSISVSTATLLSVTGGTGNPAHGAFTSIILRKVILQMTRTLDGRQLELSSPHTFVELL